MKIIAIVVLLIAMLLLSVCDTENTDSIFTNDTENDTLVTWLVTEEIKEVSIPKFELVDNTSDILKETDENITFCDTKCFKRFGEKI